MLNDRRNFLKKSGVLFSGLAFGSFMVKGFLQKPDSDYELDKHLKKFGLQLWTIKDFLSKDPKDTLKQVASYGYKQIESFEGNKGMFWGMSNKEFKNYMDDLGMKIISSHCDINTGFEKKVFEASEIGMKYLICPFIGKQKTLDDYKKFADKFNACGEICKKNGLRFAYHNHWYSFEMQDGKIPHEILLANSNPDLVDYEMDIYWVVTAGADPIQWLQNYPNRFRLVHVKDRKKDASPNDRDASCILGEGSIDYHKITKAASKNGVKYFIVEQEKFENSTSLKSAEADAVYMKSLKIG